MNRFIYGRRIIAERDRYRKWIDPRVYTLPLPAVVTYLRERGWEEVPPDRPGSRVFREPANSVDEEPCYQFVPESDLSPHYRQQMFELITGVAELENRQAFAVIDDILALPGAPVTNGAAEGHVAGVESMP